MASRAKPAKRKKAAPKKQVRKKSAPKKKSGGVGRLMLGGAFVAGTISAMIAAGSLLELDRESRAFGQAAELTAPSAEQVEKEPASRLRKHYELSDNPPSRGDRTGYMVGNSPTESDGGVSHSQAAKPQRDAVLSDDSGTDGGTGVVAGKGDAPWRKYAALAPQTGNAPVIAIVIDDAGIDQKRTSRTVTLPAPVTISYLPYARDLQKQVNAARQAGHEVMLHMPMEPSSVAIDPGPHALLATYDRQKILNEINWMLDRFDGYVGVNNHMGSKFTADPERMKVVMEVMKTRGLLFLDSRTSAQSVGYSLAQKQQVPALERDVFIDDADDAAKIAEMLERTERVAAKQGYAIAIGHPRDRTLEALKKWIPSLRAKGFVLVPATDILKRNSVNATG